MARSAGGARGESGGEGGEGAAPGAAGAAPGVRQHPAKRAGPMGDLGVAVTVMMIVGDLRKKAMATLMTMFFGDPGWSSWKKTARSMQLGGQ